LTIKNSASAALGLATVAVFAASAFAGAPSIGMTSAQSGVTVDKAAVAGNATVFDGSTIQTKGYSRVQLNDGARLGLSAGSSVQVFATHLSLQSGAAEVQSKSRFEIDAGSVKIIPSDPSSVARVKLGSDNTVLVTALNSPVSVMNGQGVLVARVMPGLPLSFMPQAAGSFDSTGCVLQKTGAAIITDSTGSQVTELRGADLRKAIGNTVHVKGTVNPSATPAGGASQVVTVTSSEITVKGGCSALATKLGATTSAAGLAVAATTGAATATAAGAVAAGAVAGAGAAAGAGLGTVAIAGIVVGAAAVVSVSAAAATGAFSSTSP
jgi:hypothetical protein